MRSFKNNEEAISKLDGKKELLDRNGFINLDEFDIAINSIKENTKLKAEIEMYKQLVGEQSDLNIEQFKQIDEQTKAIDNYNKALQSWSEANNNLLRLVGDLKDEINGLKESKIAQSINFNEYGYNECPICKFSVDTDDSYCSNCGQKIYLKTEE